MTVETSSISSLVVTNLTCVRGQRALFRDLTFTASAGQTLAIEGPNGSGKTSLLRMIAGFFPPASGSIHFKLRETVSDPEERGRMVGWLGHLDGAKSQLTPAEVLSFYSGIYGATPDLAAILNAAGLARCADLPCQYLSAGQKKRLALARLSLCARPVWLLDEPLAALDAQGKQFAAQLIRAHGAQGGITLAATHEALNVDCARLSLATS